MTSKIQENVTTNITTEKINDTIKVIDGNLIFSEYHAEFYRNTSNNQVSYIVTHDNGDEQYIDCLLLNINIFDYINNLNNGDFSIIYLKEFGLFHHNGFLGVHYCGENDKQNLKDFFDKYGDYFIKDFKPYINHDVVELDERVFRLHDEVCKEIKTRDRLNELFWDR